MATKIFTHNSPSHSQEMLDRLNSLRSEGHFCDITIRVQGKVFSAHRVVLACCSDFLLAKLSGRPGREALLDLEHVTVAGFAPLLEYAYTSTLSISTDNIIDVLAAASYMQMFDVANTCSEFMKSTILWNNSSAPGSGQEKGPDPPGGLALAPLGLLSPSPVSSEGSVVERLTSLSRRKRRYFTSPQSTSCPSPQIPNASSYPEAFAQPMDPALACVWNYPFGLDRRFAPGKPKLPESLLEPGTGPAADPSVRTLSEYLSCDGARGEDVLVKVERVSDEEASQLLSASHSSLSDQQTVPGSELNREDLLISPQSSSIGSIDEGVTEGLRSTQGTPNTSGHADEDERLENVQYPYHLYINPLARSGVNGPERPFQCPTCGVRFTRIQNLKQHMLIHSGIKPFQCDRCGKKFTRAYSLKMHRLKHKVSSPSQST